MHHGLTRIFPLYLFLILIILFTACKKKSEEQNQQPGNNLNGKLLNQEIDKSIKKRGNPLSIGKIKKIKKRGREVSTMNEADPIPTEKQLLYLKIDPNNLTTDVIKSLEADSSITLMEFPFGDAAIYDDTYAIDEDKPG